MQFKVAEAQIQPIRASEFPAAARAPLNSLLDTRKLQQIFDLQLPHWEYHASRMLQEIVLLEIAARAACPDLGRAIQPGAPLSSLRPTFNLEYTMNRKGIILAGGSGTFTRPLWPFRNSAGFRQADDLPRSAPLCLPAFAKF